MQIVISRPYDDKEIVDTYVVDHDSKDKDFEVDWLKALETIQEKDPEYNVSQILVALKRKGWQIMHVSPVKVTY